MCVCFLLYCSFYLSRMLIFLYNFVCLIFNYAKTRNYRSTRNGNAYGRSLPLLLRLLFL